ncbi:glycoside hydrolase family 127 protein [Tellurirhabdus rosea]|uniref:glycoside hydrolase family 127 protein n=1 Tax=Tellurirhabdus rosea TaxID=2674997 RepID=UPI00224D4649|nr:glycoside hydrolase family 127 protein [Tellurirhabdus rosea]
MLRSLLLPCLLLFCRLCPAQDYPLVPVPFTDVKINRGFWFPRLEINRTVTLPFDFKKCEETGRITNFAVAGGLAPGTFRGIRYDDSDVFKVMEGAAYSLQTHYDARLDRYLDSLITLVAAAQEPDGYLYTIRTILKDSTARKDKGAGPTRYSYEAHSHELYNVGHMYEAAVAHHLATGKRNFLDIAVKNANHLLQVIGPQPGQLVVVPGHEETELGLAKLYRVTGDRRYLDFAQFLVDMRGRADKRKLYDEFAGYGPAYFQDHLPVTQQREATGHAVRAGYLYAAMADLAAMKQQKAYLEALTDIWTDVVERKQYITGGLGAKESGEAFGKPYELPNQEAYAETCAAVANMLWNHRMFLLTGEARYMDVFERVLYNGFLAGVSLEGDKFFYVNPLASDGQHKFNVRTAATRAPWFNTSCCPTNVVRFLPSLPGYIYALRGNALYVNLLTENETEVTLNNQKVKISQQTNYPWEGSVRLTVSGEKPVAFPMMLRIPGWATGQPMPGSLYQYTNPASKPIQVLINGKPQSIKTENGYVRLSRTWKPGDVVTLRLDMPVREVVANEKVTSDKGLIAIERGPLVYCAEGIDNNGQALKATLAPGQRFSTVVQKDLLGGITVLKSSAPAALTLIPYYAWSNRGPGEMTVWFGQRRGN